MEKNIPINFFTSNEFITKSESPTVKNIFYADWNCQPTLLTINNYKIFHHIDKYERELAKKAVTLFAETFRLTDYIFSFLNGDTKYNILTTKFFFKTKNDGVIDTTDITTCIRISDNIYVFKISDTLLSDKQLCETYKIKLMFDLKKVSL